MAKVVGVRFKDTGKTYHFNPNGFEVHTGDSVIVETSRGLEFGKAATGISDLPEEEVISPLKPIVRIATEDDLNQLEKNRELEKQAYNVCLKKIEEHKLEMDLTEAEYTFDRSKIIFYFTADGRVDFRELVKDLASEFHTRIELRQIGVRDEAKILGGRGMCSAAQPSLMISTRFQSKWQRLRGFRFPREKSAAAAEGLCAACSMSRIHMSI